MTRVNQKWPGIGYGRIVNETTDSADQYGIRYVSPLIPPAAKRVFEEELSKSFQWTTGDGVYPDSYLLYRIDPKSCFFARLSDGGNDRWNRPHSMQIDAVYYTFDLSRSVGSLAREIASMTHSEAWPPEGAETIALAAGLFDPDKTKVERIESFLNSGERKAALYFESHPYYTSRINCARIGDFVAEPSAEEVRPPIRVSSQREIGSETDGRSKEAAGGHFYEPSRTSSRKGRGCGLIFSWLITLSVIVCGVWMFQEWNLCKREKNEISDTLKQERKLRSKQESENQSLRDKIEQLTNDNKGLKREGEEFRSKIESYQKQETLRDLQQMPAVEKDQKIFEMEQYIKKQHEWMEKMDDTRKKFQENHPDR